LNSTRPTRGLLVEASSSASSAGAWTSWRIPRSKASVSTARHSTLKVGCFGKLTCRIGENHLPTLDRVKFVHAPMSIKFSVSCIRMAFRSVRFAQREGCFLFIVWLSRSVIPDHVVGFPGRMEHIATCHRFVSGSKWYPLVNIQKTMENHNF
jgi:hypothetical protein